MSKTTLKSFILCLTCFWAFSSSAQITGAAGVEEVFLQGTYLEVGVGHCGAYGTSNAVTVPVSGPVGAYHPNSGFPMGIGWVVDEPRDGWAVGGPPPYCGDFFLPGSPWEGWSINGWASASGTGGFDNMLNSSRCVNDEVTGSITTGSYTTATRQEVQWDGTWSTTSGQDLDISIKTFFPNDGSSYFVGDVALTNTSSDTIRHIYWGRFVDPDNEQPWGSSGCGSFTTNNEIVSQPIPGVECDALVTAEGTICGCFLGLGTRDPRAVVSYSSPWEDNARSLYTFGGSVTGSTTGTTGTGDWAVGIAWYFETIAPGETERFAYAYILDEDSLEAALAATAYGINVFGGGDDITGTLIDTLCPGGTLDLELSGPGLQGYVWQWVANSTITDTRGDFALGDTAITVAPTVPTSYICYGLGGLCDSLAVKIDVFVDTTPVFVHAKPDVYVCAGECIQLNALNRGDVVEYFWEDITNPGVVPPNMDDNTIIDPTVCPTVPTTYVVHVMDARGCVGEDTVFVDVKPIPTPDAGAYQLLFLGTQANLTATTGGGTSWYWDPGTEMDDSLSLTPTIIPTATRTYKFCVVDDFGCNACDSVLIEITKEPVVHIPNAFTPNGDGLNDIFNAWVLGTLVDVNFSVFNRWGQKVFESTDISMGWDGTQDGEDSDVGNYVYYFEGTDPDEGAIVRRKGVVTLIK